MQSLVIINLLKEEILNFQLLHDHVVRGSCDIMVEYFSSYTTILPSLVTIGLAEEEIICF